MLSLVIPTYNEKENLPKLVEGISKACKGMKIRIVVVDDNSPDGTGNVAESLKRKYKDFYILHRIGKKGLGSAILDGFEKCSGDIVGVIDADLSHPPKIIPKMIEALKDKDMVIASRYVKGGGTHESWSPFRKLVSKSAILLIRPLTDVKDPMSGFFLVKKSLINKTKLEPTSCKICLEILVKCKIKNFEEIPYTFINRKKGRSKIMNTKDISRYVIHVIKLYVFKIKNLVS